MSSVIVVDSSDEDEMSMNNKHEQISKKSNLSKNCTVSNNLNVGKQHIRKLITRAGIEAAVKQNKNVNNVVKNGIKKVQQINTAPKLNTTTITKMTIVNNSSTPAQPPLMKESLMKMQQLPLQNKTATTKLTPPPPTMKTGITLNAEEALKAMQTLKTKTVKLIPISTASQQMQEQMLKRKLTTTTVSGPPALTATTTGTIITPVGVKRANMMLNVKPNGKNNITTTSMKALNSQNNMTTTTTITPVIIPSMQSFNRLDADAMPPLQLMATPPHQSACNETSLNNIPHATTTTTISAQQLKKNFDNNNDCIVILPKGLTKSNQNVKIPTTTPATPTTFMTTNKNLTESMLSEKMSQQTDLKPQMKTQNNKNNNNPSLVSKNSTPISTTKKLATNNNNINTSNRKNNTTIAELELIKQLQQQQQEQLETAIESITNISPQTLNRSPLNSPKDIFECSIDLTATPNPKAFNSSSLKFDDSIERNSPPAKKMKKMPEAISCEAEIINLIDSTPTKQEQTAEKSIDLTQLSSHSSEVSENIETEEEKHVLSNVFASSSPSMSTCSSLSAKAKEIETQNEHTPEYINLLKALRKADNSADIERLIEKKLNKYYNAVPFNFLKSKGFRRNICAVISQIEAEPDLVYLHLKSVMEELKSRYHCKPTYVDLDDEVTIIDTENEKEKEQQSSSEQTEQTEAEPATVSTAQNERRKHVNLQIQKLNAALHALTKKIEALEQAEVDLEDENSVYLQEERLKKRACQIYNKICDLTGENKNAHRLMKKPIQFNGTNYPQFNKTLRAYINRTKEFPDYYDVLHMVEHCNKKYKFDLAQFQIKRLAEDAFTQVGKLLQARRKTDLYETVSHFTSNSTDPAKNDAELLAKLNENKKCNKRIGDVIAKYAREQERISEEHKSARLQDKAKKSTMRADYEEKLKQISDLVDEESNSEGEEEEEEEEDNPRDSIDDTTQDELLSSHKSEFTNGTESTTHKSQKVFVWGKITSKKKSMEQNTSNNDSNQICRSDAEKGEEDDKSNTPNRLLPKVNGQLEENVAIIQCSKPEFKIVSVCSLNTSNPATTPTTTLSSATSIKTSFLQEKSLNEIWISDDDVELVTEEITTDK